MTLSLHFCLIISAALFAIGLLAVAPTVQQEIYPEQTGEN